MKYLGSSSVNDEFQDFDEFVSDVLDTLKPASRAKVLRKMSIKLRQSNQRRMVAQIGPDGSKWTDRKGKSRKKMMRGLKLGRMLKANSNTNQLTIGWKGKAGGISRVHHYGLRDRVTERGVRVKYERRELVGLSRKDTDLNHETIEDWLLSK